MLHRFLRVSSIVSLCAVFVAVSFFTGCRPPGPKTYRISGSVTYKGKPLEAGTITLLPDARKGNSGPSGSAEIQDGKYDTRNSLKPGGGDYAVTITGYKKETLSQGLPVITCEWSTELNIRSDGVVDFEIPDDAPVPRH